eukprot:CCRYP_004580-RA/>CCRYP_004580-RA protein AED:0.01 eAED:0.01 QI:567/0.5/0.66/1/1/1/3/3983/974
MRPPSLLPTLLLTACLPLTALSKAILGVDLGSLYMKVALVQRNSPLEIVTNLHSKRKTEQMVLFDQGSRFYGADASSLMARKPHLTPSQMSVLLGRDATHPSVAILKERHYHFEPRYNETRSGVCLTVDGEEFTPEELVAMVLSHAKDITRAYGVTAPLKDCVLTVPSFYTQHERRALLDAAELADLNVLALINENSAAALHFGIDRIDADPQLYLFYNMGAGSVQVSVVRYHSYARKESKFAKEKTVGSFEVLGAGWDATLGGSSFDARLVDHMAHEFNKIWNEKRGTSDADVRTIPRAMAKLMIQANKVKHVLSANTDFPVFVDALHDDINYQTHISRAKFEEICHDLLERAAAPIATALKMANVTLEDLHAVEMIGGAMRVPKVQEAVQHALGGMELGMHLNSDESMALGAAFHGANVSTSFKVRHVGMTDVNPFVVGVDLVDLEKKGEMSDNAEKKKKGLFGIGKKKEGEDGEWSKHATIFKMGSKLGSKKTIAFSMDRDVHVQVNYEESDMLPEGTGLSIEQYDVEGVAEFAKEMNDKGLEGLPKVSLQFEMSTSGLTQLIKAEAVMEEIVMVEEEVEVEGDSEEGDNATADASKGAEEDKNKEETKEESKTDGESSKEDEAKAEGTESKTDDASAEKKDGDASEKKGDEKKEQPKKKKTKKIQKWLIHMNCPHDDIVSIPLQEKKKKHVRSLRVSIYNVGSVRPYTPAIMAESKAKLEMLAQKDKDRMMLEEAKNTYEAYIYFIRNKMSDDEESIAKVTTEEQREALLKSAEDAEEWMFDEGFNADLETYRAKYKELSEPAEKTFFRVVELEARPKAIEALTKKLDKVVELMKKWETTMEHITEEERKEVLDKVDEVRAWIEENVKKQEEADPTGEPVFKSEDVPGQTKKIESIVSRLMKKPKPKPVVESKNETDKNETTAGDAEGEKTNDSEKKEGETTESPDATESETTEEKKEESSEETKDGDEL